MHFNDWRIIQPIRKSLKMEKETISRSLSTGWTNVKNLLTKKKKQETQFQTIELFQQQHNNKIQTPNNLEETATFSLG
jgi:hypothetical protein